MVKGRQFGGKGGRRGGGQTLERDFPGSRSLGVWYGENGSVGDGSSWDLIFNSRTIAAGSIGYFDEVYN